MDELQEGIISPKTDKIYVLSTIKNEGYGGFLKQVKKIKSPPSIRAFVEINVFPKGTKS